MKKILGILLLLPFFGYAQSLNKAKVEAYMNTQHKDFNFSGVVLVAKGKEILYHKGFGKASREWNIDQSVSSRFQYASLTKQFTAALVLRLADEGQLSLDDKLSKWFPQFPKADSITVHMLLNHNSGIRNMQAIPRFGTIRRGGISKDSMVAVFANQPFDFSPGTSWNYNNSAYYLLGLICEKTSGLSFGDAISTMTKSLGLSTIAANRTDSLLPFLSTGYTWRNKAWHPVINDDPNTSFSAGNLIGTAADLHRWQEALHHGKVLKPETYTKMTTPGMANYGYALWIDSLHEQQVIRHTGSIPGFQNNAFYFPQSNLHVIVLSNRGDVRSPVYIARALAAFYFGKPVIPSAKPKIQPTNTSGLQVLAGRYSGEYLNVELKVNDGKFLLQNGSNRIELKQFDRDALFVDDGTDTQILIRRNSDGQPTGFRLVRNGMEVPLTKN